MRILKFVFIFIVAVTVGSAVMVVSTNAVFEESKKRGLDRKHPDSYTLLNMSLFGIATLILFAVDVVVWKAVFDLVW